MLEYTSYRQVKSEGLEWFNVVLFFNHMMTREFFLQEEFPLFLHLVLF